jgi:prepilin-type N-terminal cleavage/methylation domain-containing protein
VHPGRRDDDGFTVVEVLVAMVLVLVLALASSNALISTLTQLSVSRQRQWATGLATSALEQLRSLPYAAVTGGLRAADLSGDPFVTGSNSAWRLVVPASVLGSAAAIDETLVVAGGSSTPAPLYPHVSTPPAGSYPSAFPSAPSLAVYVTRTTADAGAVTLTALVRWTSPGGSTRAVVQRTRLFTPAGSGSA